MAPFDGWASTASRLQPLREGSLLFTIQFPEIPGRSMHFAAFAIFIGVLFQPCFLMITPDPGERGSDWVDPSVKAIMVLLVPVSKMELM